MVIALIFRFFSVEIKSYMRRLFGAGRDSKKARISRPRGLNIIHRLIHTANPDYFYPVHFPDRL